MKLYKLSVLALAVISYAHAVTFSVQTSSQLSQALSQVNAGDTISLADGTYTGNKKKLIN